MPVQKRKVLCKKCGARTDPFYSIGEDGKRGYGRICRTCGRLGVHLKAATKEGKQQPRARP